MRLINIWNRLLETVGVDAGEDCGLYFVYGKNHPETDA